MAEEIARHRACVASGCLAARPRVSRTSRPKFADQVHVDMDDSSSVWPEDEIHSALSKFSDHEGLLTTENRTNAANHPTQEELEKDFALPRSVQKIAAGKQTTTTGYFRRATSMFRKDKEPPAPVVGVQSHIISVEKKLLQLAQDFEDDKLKPGVSPWQKLSPVKSSDSFKNILVYRVNVEANIDVCIKTFYEGIFFDVFASGEQHCPFYSGKTEPLPSVFSFPELESADSANFIYYWMIAAPSLKKSGEVDISSKVDTYMRARITCFDDKLRELEWSPENRRVSKFIVFSGCSVDSSDPNIADIALTQQYRPEEKWNVKTKRMEQQTKRLEFDVYGYVFESIDETHTRVYHMNHIAKGLKLNMLQTALAILTRKTRTKDACQREQQRFSKLNELCAERQRSQ